VFISENINLINSKYLTYKIIYPTRFIEYIQLFMARRYIGQVDARSHHRIFLPVVSWEIQQIALETVGHI